MCAVNITTGTRRPRAARSAASSQELPYPLRGPSPSRRTTSGSRRPTAAPMASREMSASTATWYPTSVRTARAISAMSRSLSMISTLPVRVSATAPLASKMDARCGWPRGCG